MLYYSHCSHIFSLSEQFSFSRSTILLLYYSSLQIFSQVYYSLCSYCLCFITITGRGTSPYIVLHTLLLNARKKSFLCAGKRSKTGIHLATGRRTNNALPYITLAITNLILMLAPLLSFCFVLPNPGYLSFFLMVLSLPRHQHRRKSTFLSAYS
jgi:hypothetical protein